MGPNSVQGESLRKILDLFWSKELGFNQFGSLKKGETKIICVDKRIEIPPRLPLIAMETYEGGVILTERRRIGKAKKDFQGLSVEEVFTNWGIRRIQELTGIPTSHIAHWLHLYCDKDGFRPYRRHSGRRVTESDREICEKWVSRYPRAIGPYSYQHADPAAYGVVINTELVSVSLALRYDLPFWEIGVETQLER